MEGRKLKKIRKLGRNFGVKCICDLELHLIQGRLSYLQTELWAGILKYGSLGKVTSNINHIVNNVNQVNSKNLACYETSNYCTMSWSRK